MSEVLVELLVLFVGDLGLRALPEGAALVDGLALVARHELDRIRDVIGVPAHELAKAPVLEELGVLVLEVQAQLGAAPLPLGGLDLERVLAGRRPLPRLVGARGAGDDLDAVRDEVGGVEADAELPDDRDVLAGRPLGRRLLELLHELGGARAGDGAQVLHELALRHPDAGVLDDEDLGFLVGAEAYDELRLVREEAWLREPAEAELIEGVRRVGHELAEEDLLVRIEGVDDEREDPPDLGLKCVRSHRTRF